MLLAPQLLTCVLSASAGLPAPPPPAAPATTQVAPPPTLSGAQFQPHPGRLLTPNLLGASGRRPSKLVLGGYSLVSLGGVFGVVGIVGAVTASRAHTQVLAARSELDAQSEMFEALEGERELVEGQLFDPNLSELERDMLEGQLDDLDDQLEVLGDDIDALEIQRDAWTRRRSSGLTTGIVGGVLGGTMLLTGASLLIVDALRARKPAQRRLSFAPSFGRESWGLSLSGRF